MWQSKISKIKWKILISNILLCFWKVILLGLVKNKNKLVAKNKKRQGTKLIIFNLDLQVS